MEQLSFFAEAGQSRAGDYLQHYWNITRDLLMSKLAVNDEPGVLVSGQYFHHQKPARYNPAADDIAAQDRLLAACAQLSGVTFNV